MNPAANFSDKCDPQGKSIQTNIYNINPENFAYGFLKDILTATKTKSPYKNDLSNYRKELDILDRIFDIRCLLPEL